MRKNSATNEIIVNNVFIFIGEKFIFLRKSRQTVRRITVLIIREYMGLKLLIIRRTIEVRLTQIIQITILSKRVI